MVELLAPAGDISSAHAAINSGCNAIYVGLTAFSARSSAENFNFEELEKLISRAHLFGVKIYVAMNTLIKNAELEEFIKNAVQVHNLGADAIIIQDIFLGAYLKKTYPQLHLHLSTQAGVCNEYGAQLAKKYGYDRVILARETKLEDVRKITKIIETEVFVQGALCTCFSGQCYLSSFAGGNSGNRGKCKQPCRKKYKIDRKGFEEYAYRISLADLSVGEDINALIEAGVSSFKIEGRMRRPEYVAAAVGYYKKLLENQSSLEELSALKRTYNRGNYTKGLAFGQDKSFISSAVQGHIGEFIGTVQVTSGKYFVRTQIPSAEGDGYKILREGREVCGAAFAGSAKGGVYIKSSARLKNGDKVFITTDAALNKRLLSKIRTFGVDITATIEAGKEPIVTLNGIPFIAPFKAVPATGRPMQEADFTACFNKVDKYPFKVNYKSLSIGKNVFVAASLLNVFRREIYQKFYEVQTKNPNLKIEKILPLIIPESAGETNTKTCLISTCLKGSTADIGVLKPADYSKDFAPLLDGFKGEKYLYLPPYISGGEIQSVLPELSSFDGIYSNGYYAIELCERLNKKLFAGTGFNLFNSLSISLLPARYAALSKELTVREAKELAGKNTFYLTGGDMQVMDLIYCPFSLTCKSCDGRETYALCDEDGREFCLRRYLLNGSCRFEIFNCAALNAVNNFTGVLTENVTLKNYKNVTKGHSEKQVF